MAHKKTAEKNEAAEGEIVYMSLRVPKALHERLRKMNYETKESMHAFALRGIEAALKAAKY